MFKRATFLFLALLITGCSTMDKLPSSLNQSATPQPLATAKNTPDAPLASETPLPVEITQPTLPPEPTGTTGPKSPAEYLAGLQARNSVEPVIVPDQFTQKYRPQFHFSPINGWIGDPDGTIHYQGVYHLFWWGHAESTDLVHWKQRPFPSVNLPGVDSGSGSVIVDLRNASGFAIPGQKPPMLAFFTIFNAGDNHQAPGMAVSYDYTNFAYYDQNPLFIHDEKGFRDPHVFYYAPTDSYVTAIAISDQRKIGFYGSKDLKHWQHLSDFGPIGAISQVWECPDLFQLPVDGDPTKMKWVMLVGMGPNTEQYFIGDFDGVKFTLDKAANPFLSLDQPIVSGRERANWLDFGADYYAVRTFHDYDNPTGPIVAMGWLGNWEYANNVPTEWGKGSEALPRELSLKTVPGGLRIVQTPIPALQSLRKTPVQIHNRVITGSIPLSEFKPARNTYEMDLTFEITDPKAQFGVRVGVNGDYGVSVGYDAANGALFLDRTNPENAYFSPRFAKYLTGPLTAQGKQVRLHIYVDQSSIELFANGGEASMSALMFPNPDSLGIQLFSDNGDTKLISLSAWELDSIWGVAAPRPSK